MIRSLDINKPISLYKVTQEAINTYKETVRGNSKIPNDIIRKKLTRNILLARKLDNDEKGNEVYLYGKLIIIVEPKSKTVVEVSNYTICDTDNWKKDIVKYNYLNSVLGITSTYC